jgi:hypothetical protein
MRARHRHFNPAHAGASLVLDARYINQSDNTAVSTWADRSGNGSDATQATGAFQPTFQTAEQGGNGVVRFDGSNDFLVLPSLTLGANWAFFAAFKIADVVNSNRAIFGPSNSFGQHLELLQLGITSRPSIVRLNNGERNSAANRWFSDNVFGITTMVMGANFSGFLNGTAITLLFTNSATIAAAVYAIGRYYTNGFNSAPDFACLTIMTVTPNQSLRRRLEHASAFSFKISCN